MLRTIPKDTARKEGEERATKKWPQRRLFYKVNENHAVGLKAAGGKIRGETRRSS